MHKGLYGVQHALHALTVTMERCQIRPGERGILSYHKICLHNQPFNSRLDSSAKRTSHSCCCL